MNENNRPEIAKFIKKRCICRLRRIEDYDQDNQRGEAQTPTTEWSRRAEYQDHQD